MSIVSPNPEYWLSRYLVCKPVSSKLFSTTTP